MISAFVTAWYALEARVYQNAVDKGFHDAPREDGTSLALIHSELSEALEALREGNPESIKIPGYSQLEEELADVVIRVMDYARSKDMRVAESIEEKIKYNRLRIFKHGKKF